MPDGLHKLCKDIVGCELCPRLVEYRQDVAAKKRAAYRNWDYWGKPVPGFGDPLARLYIVGLAPAAHGANRTGRVFTGDSSGAFLMQGLYATGFANQPTSISRDDGLTLSDAYIMAAVRCVPPDNKPLPSEIVNCRKYFLREIALLKQVRAVLALGKIGMDAYLQTLKATGAELPVMKFAHGAEYQLPGSLPRLFVSYHPSQQNTQTGRLTREMFDAVLKQIRLYIGGEAC